jgi:F-type H+-transporting ATPase subunit epsilon
MPLQLDIVTIEGRTYSQEVDMVVAPGSSGEMGILPNHAPLLTSIKTGMLRIKRGFREEFYAVGGGYMEVLPDRVTVLADTAERSDHIDTERAQAARERAEEYLASHAEEAGTEKFVQMQAELQRATVRIKVAHTQRRKRSTVHTRRPDQD